MAERREFANGHIQFIGKVIVNYYKTKDTAYIIGSTKGFDCTESYARKIADSPNIIQKSAMVKSKRKNMKGARKRMWNKPFYKICYVCNRKIDTYEECSVEHIIPLCKGGSNRSDNLTLSHKKCNEERGERI